nr:MATE family efflux transporter [Natronocalculus amylovorans]
MSENRSRVDMTTGAITPKLFTLAWPLVLGNLLQTFYNLADMFWVGRVSDDAVAAVSLMFPLSWMFISTAMGITAATIALVSQHVGAGNDRRADHVVAQTTLLALVVSTALSALGLAFRYELLTLIGAEGQVFVEALAYIEIIFLSIPLTFLFFAFRSSLQGAGDTKTAMWLMVASAGLNVVLDPFFILGWGPFPELGTQGAAVATFIARFAATAAGVYILLRGGFGVQLRVADLKPDPQILKKLVGIGYPATIDGWARSFAAVVMAAFVARFSVAAIAAYGIGVRLMSVSWSVAGAVGQATATGVGQNLGSETPDRAVEVTWKATAATMGMLAVAAGLVIAFPATAMEIFISEQAVIDEGVRFLQIVAPSWAFFGGVMVIQGAFRGAGVTKVAMVLSFLSRWIFRIPLALVLAFAWTITVPGVGIEIAALDYGVSGLWVAYTTAAVLSFGVAVVWFSRGTWKDGVIATDRHGSTAD